MGHSEEEARTRKFLAVISLLQLAQLATELSARMHVRQVRVAGWRFNGYLGILPRRAQSSRHIGNRLERRSWDIRRARDRAYCSSRDTVGRREAIAF
jgi:hypothetical protein